MEILMISQHVRPAVKLVRNREKTMLILKGIAEGCLLSFSGKWFPIKNKMS